MLGSYITKKMKPFKFENVFLYVLGNLQNSGTNFDVTSTGRKL